MSVNMHLKIRGKLLAVFLGGLFLFTVLTGTIIVRVLSGNQEEEIAAFRQEELSRTKQTLKNYVDIAYETLDSNYTKSQNNEFLRKQYGPRLKDIIDVAEEVIRENMSKVAVGVYTPEEARREAALAVGKMRYADGTGYIWINDTSLPYPRMVMHPTVPSLDGRILDDPKYNCAQGTDKNLFRAFVDVTAADGEGFVDYLWPKPTKDGLSSEQPKLSYVRRVAEWDWVIGTGIYVDDALADALEKSRYDIEKMRYDNGVGYFWINDTGKPFPKMIMHPTVPELNNKVLDAPKYNCALGTGKNLFQAFVDVTATDGEGYVDYLWPKPTADGLTSEQPKLSYVRLHPQLDWIIGTGVYIDAIDAIVARKAETGRNEIRYLLGNIGMAIAVVFVILAGAISLFCIRYIVNPLQRISSIAGAVATGDLDQKVDIKGHDEIGQLGESMSKMVRKLLDNRLEIDKRVYEMEQVFMRISVISEEVASGAFQLAGASHSLSQGANEQAASLEEISSSMVEINEQTRINAENAGQANSLSQIANDAAAKGNSRMSEMVEAMNEIDAAGQDIHKIIKVIDEIAFQTNLLALNAAVEAARAGKYGRGFAVVAEEVRNLAARSARAAKETTQLIQGTVEKTRKGNDIAQQSAESLNEIVENVSRVYGLVAEIAIASNEQAQSISQINSGLEQVDKVTQLNTANAEETAAASEELSSQSNELMKVFRQIDTLEKLTLSKKTAELEHPERLQLQ